MAPSEIKENLENHKNQNKIDTPNEIKEIFEISGPKLDQPLPNLPPGQKIEKEKLHHITPEEMKGIECENSISLDVDEENNIIPIPEKLKNNQIKPEEKIINTIATIPIENEINTNSIQLAAEPIKSSLINVVDYNGSEKDIITEHHLSIDNEELIPEKDNSEEIKFDKEQKEVSNLQKKLDIIQENGNETSNSNGIVSGRNARHNRRQCNLNIEHLKGIPLNKSKGFNSRSIIVDEGDESEELTISRKQNINNSFCSARDKQNNQKRFIRRLRNRPKSSREKCYDQNMILSENSNTKPNISLDTSEKLKEEIKDQVKEVKHNNDRMGLGSNNMSINGIPSINSLKKGTAECSTTYTAENAKSLFKKPLQKLDQAFLAKMAGDSKGTDHLASSTAGVLFGAGPLSGYIGLQTNTGKGTMFQSFSTNKPTLPGGFSGNLKNGGGNNSSSITIKKLDDSSSEYSGLVKIKKKNIIQWEKSPDLSSGTKNNKFKVVVQTQQEDSEGKIRSIKRLKLKKDKV